MISIERPEDLNRSTLEAVAYDEVPLRISPSLLAAVDAGRKLFLLLIENGTPCYGVTTGLGRLSGVALTAEEKKDISKNILRARAAAFGPPFEKPVVRALMVVRLVNFLSARDGVRSNVCRFLVDRLNDDFTPWVPQFGHGMAADAIANSHAFQTFIGEGYVQGQGSEKYLAATALSDRGVKPLELLEKEGLALINGLTISIAYTLHACRRMSRTLSLANMVSAVSLEGMAACKDAVDAGIKVAGLESGTETVINILHAYLAGSEIESKTIQSPVSYRVIPQVHGALVDAVTTLLRHIDRSLVSFSGNPLLVTEDDGRSRLLSVGLFHDQHLVNQVDHTALCLAHVGILSQRRLHRLLDADMTGLSTQLAARPGLDAGLVVTQKASLGLEARLRTLVQPVSLYTGESSAGQEDYMTMGIPAVSRLFEMAETVEAMLAYEFLAGLVALTSRNGKPGSGVGRVRNYFSDRVPKLERDRPPGPDVEIILHAFRSVEFQDLLHNIERAP